MDALIRMPPSLVGLTFSGITVVEPPVVLDDHIVSVRRLVISPDFRNFLTFKRMPNVVADLSAAADRKD